MYMYLSSIDQVIPSNILLSKSWTPSILITQLMGEVYHPSSNHTQLTDSY